MCGNQTDVRVLNCWTSCSIASDETGAAGTDATLLLVTADALDETSGEADEEGEDVGGTERGKDAEAGEAGTARMSGC